MVSQVSLLDCELALGPHNPPNEDGHTSVPSASQENVAPQMPVKKPRQWAAWTRDEEESFFAALRQNFEKITCRVQSKNKDQVRHYYYRLVRRMNKLLGPELSLDAKNSKDTNAAMLRWWSLLEKYSCKPSKLHLKPRRFKIFVETLENQLMKDRKKNTKKRLSTGENNPPVSSVPTSNQVRPPGHDNRSVKAVLVDSQNIPKVGTGKGASLKRNMPMETGRNNCKIDPTSAKTAKLRRKTGLASAAAYKRWEKAAIAGVSLVADAAEHLEKVDTNKGGVNFQETPGHDGSKLVPEVAQQTSPEIKSNENNSNNSMKLKLQLFPIDECTRKALEMDNRNPHLELTLSTRKKISSILEHLNRKWGSSSSSNQELMLLPYWAQRENLVGYQKWTKDSNLCAADVYYSIGSPLTFRLRYGWFSKAEIEAATAQVLSFANTKEQNTNISTAKEKNAETESPNGLCDNQFGSAERIINMTPSCTPTPIKVADCSFSLINNNASGLSSLGKASEDLAVMRQTANMKDMPLSAGEWADSLTNISMGELLSESEHNIDASCANFSNPRGSNCFQQIPFSCDSFDAAIAAHIYKHQVRVESQPSQSQGNGFQVPSIWDGEETCDAFAFKKTSSFHDKDPNATCMDSSVEVFEPARVACPLAPHKEVEELPHVEILPNSDYLMDDDCGANLPLESSTKNSDELLDGGKSTNNGDLIDDDCGADHPLENSTKDLGGLTDIYWPESLGPLDLDITPCRYNNNELILSDSLGGLNRLIANSLDGFQSCSFFGLDKKGASSSSEARQSVTFSNFKVGSEV
ncbi:TSL-kinase interacting protein 1 [Striga hermonthica]|uniref:TSL-kinase interacting protein 1 n=1 Tax=Striga hermonthica TaxID=68872 RepID=A0A9N7RRC6_STRHE|nr:TSL-kinase interacting protein 1 [Striga hermonthica]